MRVDINKSIAKAAKSKDKKPKRNYTTYTKPDYPVTRVFPKPQ